MKRLLLPLLLVLALPAFAQGPSSPDPTDLRPPTSDPSSSLLNPSPLNPEPFILERASAETAVQIPHKKTGQKIAESLRAKGLSEDAAIVAISTLPIVELRGAIPVGHVLLPDTDHSTRLGLDDLRRATRIFCWAILGNMLPVPFILLLLGPVSTLCMKIPLGKKFFDWLFARTRRKTADIEKYETLGLTVFVAIPLPATGAMAGWLLGMSFAHSLLSIFLGVLVAGVIMTALALLGWIGAALAGAVLLAFFLGILAKALKR